MRIALLTYSTKPRGSVIHTIELATALHRSGQQVCIYALDKDGQGFDRSLSCAYRAVSTRPVSGDIDALIQQRIQEFVLFFERSASDCQHDIFHAQDCISANALAILRQRGLIRHFVRTVHHIEDYNSVYLQQCQDRSIREPDLCVCVSDYWQQQLKAQYGIAAARVINGVDADRFSPISSPADAELRVTLGLRSGPVYLTVGGIEPRKNTLQLLQAFAQVLTVHPQAQLVIAGGATLFDYQDYRDRFFQQVERLHLRLEDSIRLPGVIADRDLPSLYRCADAFVFPSVKEGWGLVVLEALASGLPVIVSDQPPFTEFLTAEQALFVVPHQPDSIAQAMLDSVQPTIAQRLRQHSRSVVQCYSWANSATMHLNHYQALLSQALLSQALLSAADLEDIHAGNSF